MNGLLALAGLRYHARHPWLLALSLAGVAVGVAVIVGVDVANSSAQRAFQLSADAVTGRATHSIVGSGGSVPEERYVALRVERGVRSAAPVVEGFVRRGRQTLTVLGIDPLADETVRPGSGRLDPVRFLTQPGAVALSDGTALDLDVEQGDTLHVTVDGVREVVSVVAILVSEDELSRRARQNLLIADVSTAQELLRQEGFLSRVDLVLDAQQAAAVGSWLPGDLTLEPASNRSETISQMTRAFEMNLSALSLLALVVGMFLIYNITTFSVVQRRPVLGKLRAMGVGRRQIILLVMTEAAVIGWVGSVLGVAAGLGLGTGLVRLVTRSINDLYFVVTVQQMEFQPGSLMAFTALGVASTLLAAWIPARSAARSPASSVLRRSDEEDRFRAAMPRLAVLSLVSMISAAVLLASDRGGIAVAYAGLALVLLAFGAAAPVVIDAAARVLGRLVRDRANPTAAMAVGGIRAHLSRTSVAVAALGVAVAAAIGVGIMVGSFRQTVDTWLGYALEADLYIQPPGAVARRGGGSILPELEQVIRLDPDIVAAYGVRRIQTDSDVGTVDVVAIEHGTHTRGTYRFVDEGSGDPWIDLDDDTRILVSEPFAFKHAVAVGDSLRLTTADGPRRFLVGAIYYDYGSDLGAVLMGRAPYERLFRDDLYSGLAVFVRPGIDRDAVAERLRQSTVERQRLIIASNADLRSASLEIFDRTFTVTWVLRILAIVVAIIGIVSALAALQLERAFEFGVLRALGVGGPEVGRLVRLQSTLMGLFAGLLSVPLGIVLAWGLVFVINRRSFGWTLQFVVDPGLLVQAVLVAVVAALAASWFPARKLRNLAIRSLLR